MHWTDRHAHYEQKGFWERAVGYADTPFKPSIAIQRDTQCMLSEVLEKVEIFTEEAIERKYYQNEEELRKHKNRLQALKAGRCR